MLDNKSESIAQSAPETPGTEDNLSTSRDYIILHDYVMLDFADDFFPDGAANSRLRKSHIPPELSG